MPPALLTTMSRWPSRSIADDTASWTASGSVTSATSTTTRLPADSTAGATSASRSRVARQHGDVGTGLGVRDRDRPADPARRAGHQRGLAGQVDAHVAALAVPVRSFQTPYGPSHVVGSGAAPGATCADDLVEDPPRRTPRPPTGAAPRRRRRPGPAGPGRTGAGPRPAAGSRRARARARAAACRTRPSGPGRRRSPYFSGGLSRIAPSTPSRQPHRSARSVPNDQPSSHTVRQARAGPPRRPRRRRRRCSVVTVAERALRGAGRRGRSRGC